MDGFAKRLTNLREKRGLQKKQLADILNVSIACVSQYEKGTSMPGYDILLTIARYFNVTVDYLLGNEDATKQSRWDEHYTAGVTYKDLMNYCVKVPEKNRAIAVKLIKSLQESDIQ